MSLPLDVLRRMEWATWEGYAHCQVCRGLQPGRYTYDQWMVERYGIDHKPDCALKAEIARLEAETVQPSPATQREPFTGWHDFHRQWTEAVGQPGYDKSEWGRREAELIRQNASPATPPTAEPTYPWPGGADPWVQRPSATQPTMPSEMPTIQDGDRVLCWRVIQRYEAWMWNDFPNDSAQVVERDGVEIWRRKPSPDRKET